MSRYIYKRCTFVTDEGASTSVEIFVYITSFINILMKTPKI